MLAHIQPRALQSPRSLAVKLHSSCLATNMHWSRGLLSSGQRFLTAHFSILRRAAPHQPPSCLHISAWKDQPFRTHHLITALITEDIKFLIISAFQQRQNSEAIVISRHPASTLSDHIMDGEQVGFVSNKQSRLYQKVNAS